MNQVILSAECLSPETEHALVGTLITDAPFRKQVFAATAFANAVPDRSLLSREFDPAHGISLIDNGLNHLAAIVRSMHLRAKGRNSITHEAVDLLIADIHVDAKEKKYYVELLNRCVLATKGQDPVELYERYQQTYLSKRAMATQYAGTLEWADPAKPKSGPDLLARISKHAAELQALTKQFTPYRPPTAEEKRAKLTQQEEFEETAVANAIPFVHSGFNDRFKITQGLTIIGGYKGSGKSTTSGNILCSLLEHKPDAKVLIISNEETERQVLRRIACLKFGLYINDFMEGRYSRDSLEYQQVRDWMNGHVDNFVIYGNDSETVNTTCLEDVQRLMMQTADDPEQPFSLIIVDYLQRITTSIATLKGVTETNKISKAFGNFLVKNVQTLKVPVILFAQLRTSQNRSDEPMADRIENDRSMGAHANVMIEIVRDKDTGVTEFLVQKARWGRQDVKMQCNFQRGRYIPLKNFGPLTPPAPKGSKDE